MFHYIRKYIPLGLAAVLMMTGEVTCDLFQPRLMTDIVDRGVLQADTGLILTTGLIMAAVAVAGVFCGSLNGLCAQTAAQRIGNDIRKDAVRRIMRFSFSQTEKYSSGALVTRITSDITQIQTMCMLTVRGMIRTAVQIVGSLVFLTLMDVRFALIVLAAMPVLLFAIFLTLRHVSPYFSRMQEELDELNSLLAEDLTGIRVIKACVRELREKERFAGVNRKLTDTQLHVLLVFALLSPAANALMYTVITLLLLTGSREVALGFATPGQVMAAVTYATQLLNAILRMVMFFQNISRGVASWKRVREVLEEKKDMTDGTDQPADGAHGTVEFRDVTFRWTGEGQPALSHVSFSVGAGETVGIMGATGSGKITLVSLIPRFYDVTEGAVLVDGQDVRAWPKDALRQKVSIALQTSQLFGRTIQENIALGKPDALTGEIVRAAEAAQADGFIREKEEGYDSPVAERGMSLSGGQKQRIAVARALLKDAEILILDDATSALDLATEAALYEALGKLRPGLTKLIVAQRAASVRHADRILLLEEGCLAASGTHEELMASCEAYREIVSLQTGEEENA